MPMIMITGQKGILSRKQARFQIVDVVASMTPLTKMARQIVSTGHDPDHRARGFPASRSKSGPGRCIWSFRRTSPARRRQTIPLVPPHPDRFPVAHPGGAGSRGGDDPGSRAAADHAGRRGQPAAAADALSEFVRRVQIPFFNTQMGKGSVPGGSDLYMGTAALSERDYVHEADRPRRSDHRDRPRHGGEAAVHHGSWRADR